MNKDQMLPFFATLKPVQEFRTSFRYNNWGYEIVALVLEKITGRPLSELLHERLFEPLGMHNTSTSWQHSDDNSAKSYCVLDDLSSRIVFLMTYLLLKLQGRNLTAAH
jgi:CubicO group peptidase (beta-lactamase class C family)